MSIRSLAGKFKAMSQWAYTHGIKDFPKTLPSLETKDPHFLVIMNDLQTLNKFQRTKSYQKHGLKYEHIQYYLDHPLNLNQPAEKRKP